MILLNGVVPVFTGADGEGATTLSQLALGITLHEGNSIGLTAVYSDLVWPAMLASALRIMRLAAFRSRFLQNTNAMVLPLLSMARYRYTTYL